MRTRERHNEPAHRNRRTMKTRMLCGIIALTWLSSAQIAQGVTATASDIGEARQWTAAHFEAPRQGRDAEPFFSFTDDGKPSAELLKTWKVELATRSVDDHRTERTLAYTDPQTGLIVRCVGVEYSNFLTVEWTGISRMEERPTR
jgi:hypothetical protein